MTPTALEKLIHWRIEALPPGITVGPGQYGVRLDCGFWRLNNTRVCPIGALLLARPVRLRVSPRETPMEATLREEFNLAPKQWRSVVVGFDGNGECEAPLQKWFDLGARLRAQYCPRKVDVK